MVIAYYRVSTDKQDIGIDVQKAQVAQACALRGWTLHREFEEKVSAKTMNRPELQKALGWIKSIHLVGEPNVLIVAKLDRLSRSVLDFVTLVERSKVEGWSIVALDLGVDTTTPAGEFMANIIASVAQMERRLISQRTKDALAVKIARGEPVGKPAERGVTAYIRHARADGMSLQTIADYLNLMRSPTAHGGKQWHKSTVRSVLLRKSA